MSRLARRIPLFIGTLLLASCSSVSYVSGEMSGSVKPVGGITESIPVTKSYSQSPEAVRAGVLASLQDQGYVMDLSSTATELRTEPKVLPKASSSMMVEYSARVFVSLAGSNVSYRARFNKKSSLVEPSTNLEFTEKENELRRDFFQLLDKKLPS
ncbi:MAG: hypothetical protein IPN37_04320 [Betaproteobacteria bacterium]|nr:hypothetical protein [Betaproteobacteria bacterium]